jgi:hypothetical protein
MTCGIYRFISPSGKCYVGQSENIERRLIEHRSASTYKNPKFYNAIKKYGFDNMTFEILEECEKGKLVEKEIYWISHFNSFNEGYNSTTGGEGGYIRSEETIEKLRQAFTGVYNGSQNIPFYIDEKLYSSIGVASKDLHIPIKTIHNRLNSKNIKYSNYRYKDESLIPVRVCKRNKIEINGIVYDDMKKAQCSGYSIATIYRALKGIPTKNINSIKLIQP